MGTQSFQKILSFFLIFFIFFSIIVRVPLEMFLGASVYATNDEVYDLVSIIVDEETYDEVRSKLVRYSRDVQAKLENTRVIIIPTPSTASVLDIASLNESLYNEGYKAHKDVNFESRLVGTVLVGKIPVPVVFTGSNSVKTLAPYVDFQDKAFIFNHKSEKYEENQNVNDEFQAEVWHGVISPNTGEFDSDIQAIEDYFDKNHDYYTGAGVFDQDRGVIDGQKTSAEDDYEPYVFYYDQFRESEALQYQKYIGYDMYLQNIEDITYNRYSKELAEKVKNQVLGGQNLEVADLIKNVDPDFNIEGLSAGPDVNTSPDIATRYITDNSTKRFLEIFNSSALGDMRKHVYNAGRYNQGGSKVNVDMPPFLISVLDEVSAEVIKNVNDSLEDDITSLVTNGLSRDIALPVSSRVSEGERPVNNPTFCPAEYTTHYFGQASANITNASECSIYRGSTPGSGTLVESNRGYNINNVEADANLCGLGIEYDEDSGTITKGLSGFWGGNSPVNLTQQGGNYSDFQLGDHNLKGGIRPVYDILGMKEISDRTKTPSPIDCFSEGSHIQTYKSEVYIGQAGNGDTTFSCGTKFSLPISSSDSLEYYATVPNGQPRGTTHESRFCAADNIIAPSLPEFREVYLNGLDIESCTSKTAFLDSELVLRSVDPNLNTTVGSDGDAFCVAKKFIESEYKRVSSHVLHTSPTDDEFGAQVKATFTPSLPIDSDRYIDFIGARGGSKAQGYGYERIDFPQLFRVNSSTGQKPSFENVSAQIKKHLDEVSDQINGVISRSDPSNLTLELREPKTQEELFTLMIDALYERNPEGTKRETPKTQEEFFNILSDALSQDSIQNQDQSEVSNQDDLLTLLTETLSEENIEGTLNKRPETEQDLFRLLQDALNQVDNSGPRVSSIGPGSEKDLYELLKTGEYPSEDVDLYQDMVSKPLEVFSSDNQSKQISYFDTLVFAVYWNNLNSVSSKYKFIFEEYLGNQFEGNTNKFHLPNSRKSYEMAYFAAPGDAENMYIKLDPEEKAIHPYADILSKNITLQSTLQASNVGTPTNSSQSPFACAPPDGVPIWEWIPAVTCWIGNMLPPTIGLSAGTCGHSDIFLTSEEQDFIKECKGDINKNGVNDCLESKLETGTMTLLNDAGKYYYNTAGVLTAQIYDTDGEKAFFDNASYIEFELDRVEIPLNPENEFIGENIKTVFDIDDAELSTPQALRETQKYVNFQTPRTRAQRGSAKGYFSVMSEDANLYFRTSVTTLDSSGVDVINIESSQRRVEVRGDRLFVQSYALDEDGQGESNDTIIASGEQNIFISDGTSNTFENIQSNLEVASGAQQKLWFSLTNYSKAGNTLSLNYPLTLELEKDGETVFSETNISASNLSGLYPLFSARESGSYRLQVQDASGLSSYKNIDILPDTATKIIPTLGTNVMEMGGNISTHLFTITDQYDNPATGDIYTVDVEIEGRGLNFQESTSQQVSYQVIDGFKAFRLISTDIADDNIVRFTLTDPDGIVIKTVTREIQTLENININITPPTELPTVGGDQYTYKVDFLDADGNIVTGLNSRLYLGMSRLYGTPVSPYAEIINGQSEISFTTSELAGQDIKLEFQFEGGNDIYKETIDILPGLPVKVDLNVSQNKIEASTDSTSIVEALLKDQFGNIVFTDNTTSIQIEIPDQSQSLLNVATPEKTVKNGKVQFELRASEIPGRAFFKAGTTPDISENSFTIIGQRPFQISELTVPTMKSSSGSLSDIGENFFQETSNNTFISRFPTKDLLQKNKNYDELSPVLQGQLEVYFDTMNSSSITGVGENASSVETFFFWDKQDIQDSAYKGIYSILAGAPYGDILKRDYLGGALLFERNNSALAVSSLLESPYKFHDISSIDSSGAITEIGSGDITQDIEYTLDIDSEGRITVDMFNAALETYAGRVYYNLSEETNIEINVSESGGYTRTDRGDDVIIRNSSGKILFEALENGRFIRKSGVTLSLDTGYNGKGMMIELYSGDEKIGNLLIVGQLQTNITRDAGLLQNKLQSLQNTIIVHLESNQYDTRRVFSDSETSILKVYYKDPFANRFELNDIYNSSTPGLENIQQEKGIGFTDQNTMLLAFAAGESVGSATRGFQSLSLINLGDPVVSLKALDRFFPNSNTKKSFDSTLGETLIYQEGLEEYKVFDYNNDDRADILTITRDGYMQLHEGQDIEGVFIQQNNIVFAGDRGSARMVQTGDFSGDGYDDIFFVDQAGKPNIYVNSEKDFIRQDISQQFDAPGAIVQVESFDMDADTIDDIITLHDTGNIHIFYGGGSTLSPEFTKNIVGNSYGVTLSDTTLNHGGAIYFDGIVQKGEQKNDSQTQKGSQYLSELQASLDAGSDAPNPDFIDSELVDQFLYVSLPYSDGDTLENMSSGSKQYLRSEYANIKGVEIQKSYTDINEGYIVSGDRVYLDILLKNTSNSDISNISYVDNISKYFRFENESFITLGTGQKNLRSKAKGSYGIVVENFSLAAGEQKLLRFEIQALPLMYGDMQVGLYEEGEVGDDLFGDIIVKEDTKNCGATADIYRSTGVRLYKEGETNPSCEGADVSIGNTHPNLVDVNNDGVPDYLENIIDTQDTDLIKDYADEAMSKLHTDTDQDGIPDSDDSMDRTDSAVGFMGALSQIDEAAGEISEEIDTIIEGMSCGFGGGSCITTPLNWAPLAPGNDPTLFGFPVGDGLRVSEGFPVFSAFTGLQIFTSTGPKCVRSVFPVSALAYIPGPVCGPPSAGGVLGTWAPTNKLRIFVTPTLTGAVGTAVCFGGPALAAGNSNPIGLHPIIPGGNCIVTAVPVLGCEGGEGDPGVMGYPSPANGFSTLHANCNGDEKRAFTPARVQDAFVKDYLEYQRTGVEPDGLYDKFIRAFEEVSENGIGNYQGGGEPLVSIGGSSEGLMSTQVSFDGQALAEGNFQDVIQVQNKRIAGFPGFIMDWVEAQLDEVTSKLTNLPKVQILYPSFAGVFDGGFEDYIDGTSEAFKRGVVEDKQTRDDFDSELQELRDERAENNCDEDYSGYCVTLDARLNVLNPISSGKQYASGIKEVYDFLGNIPLVNIQSEKIPVSIPWMETSELERFILDWQLTYDQWQEELSDFGAHIEVLGVGNICKDYYVGGGAGVDVRGSVVYDAEGQIVTATAAGVVRGGVEAGRIGNPSSAQTIANCIQEHTNLIGEAQELIDSLGANIQILQEYQEFPEKLSKLITKKEDWLEQILCNIDAISQFMGEWIRSNGERFKAWVEFYILVKAILKSWQVFIDIFNGYDAECHECKNERQDLQNFFFNLVASIIPSAPVIQFPKWPDIILDLSNVRVGMTIVMPELDVQIRPLVLPNLPELSLPRVDLSAAITGGLSVNFDIPELKLLPSFDIIELPDIPSLPSFELPDLPPPLKIPKLFGAVDGMLNIVKLITRVMCILKGSPFVPEWRAGDQIAFLTERNGYLPTDFLNIQAPAFSYSAISAIEIKSYVNFEFEMDFIAEAVRSITAPLDSMTGNIVNLFDISLGNIEVTVPLPDTNLDIDLGESEIRPDISLAPLDENPDGINFLAALVVAKSQEFLIYLSEQSSITLSNAEFKKYIGSQLAQTNITENQRTAELQNVWNNVLEFKDTTSQKFIDSLQENNTQKFQTLQDIIQTEIRETKKQKDQIKNIKAPGFLTQIAVSENTTSSRVRGYNQALEAFNMKTQDAALTLVSGESKESQEFRNTLKKDGEKLMSQVRGGLESYKKNTLLAAENAVNPASGGTCSTGGAYDYKYEGIYVLEDDKNYKLFDYTDILRGDEKITSVDIDSDGDDDVVYHISNRIYFKENRKRSPLTEHVSGPPLILNVGDNKMFNGDVYYEALNGFSEIGVSDGSVNIEFEKPTQGNISHYSLTYDTLIDRSIDTGSDYTPERVQTHIVDAINSQDGVKSENIYTLTPHTATLVYAGAMKDIVLKTPKLTNIATDIVNNTLVTLTAKKSLFAGSASFTIRFTSRGQEAQVLRVPAYESVSFSGPVEISELRGDAYIASDTFEEIRDTQLLNHIGKPILAGSKIVYSGNTNTLDEGSRVDIRYADTSLRQVDFRDISSFELYDLGRSYGNSHKIRLDIENDFYYGRIQIFSENVFGTLSQQILLAPQSESDVTAPKIGLGKTIRIPVYQSVDFDLTPYIYEDGGLGGISNVSVDFDINVDSDNDGNSQNDSDTENLGIEKTPARIVLTFGPYDEIFTQDISIALTDDNDNVARRTVQLEVYTPEPSIDQVSDNEITGKIDEQLLSQPVGMYRFRGGLVEKLRNTDNSEVANTDVDGNYTFNTSKTSSGLTLKQSGNTIASINEFTGQIITEGALTSINVLASNDVENTSLYPEIQVLYAESPVFRQYMKTPKGEIGQFNGGNEETLPAISLQILDQDRYGSFRVPLGASYNPGSVSVFITSDSEKRPVMTVFRDGRINIDNTRYTLKYQNVGDTPSFVLVQKGTNTQIAELIYTLESSYILR